MKICDQKISMQLAIYIIRKTKLPTPCSAIYRLTESKAEVWWGGVEGWGDYRQWPLKPKTKIDTKKFLTI